MRISSLFLAVVFTTKGAALSPSRRYGRISTRHSVVHRQQPNKQAIHNIDAYVGLSLRGGASTERSLMSEAAASLLAGSVAGAIGVGIAFPLDSLKTKQQVMPGGTTVWNVISYVWQNEGIRGFFQGVRLMMVAQAIIKSSAFACNNFGLTVLSKYDIPVSNTSKLLLAACFSGFVTTFIVVPFERIKIMMQAAQKGVYNSSLDCLRAVLRNEGLLGLFERGLGPTLVREIPGYALYFFVAGALMQTRLATHLGQAGNLLFGAVAGMAAWIPVYPIDVVKTLMQNTEGNDETKKTPWQVAQGVYNDEGLAGFFDGMTPKLLRAAVNHAVTFFVYEMIMSAMVKSAQVAR